MLPSRGSGLPRRYQNLVAALVSLGCAGRAPPTDGGAPASDSRPSPPPTLGQRCVGGADCGAGLACETVLRRSCQGPVRAHEYVLDLPGGQCTRALFHLPMQNALVCPVGSGQLAIIPGCDGLVLHLCARPCTSDAECRVSEGYRCQSESGLCVPPALVPPPEDAAVPGTDV
ncbi:MAG: hypothetical protein HY909_08520 [Deltaproteobacteria bacterium]|nr:hypothetical protein [Deltaproteobacteria bacterium]